MVEWPSYCMSNNYPFSHVGKTWVRFADRIILSNSLFSGTLWKKTGPMFRGRGRHRALCCCTPGLICYVVSTEWGSKAVLNYWQRHKDNKWVKVWIIERERSGEWASGWEHICYNGGWMHSQMNEWRMIKMWTNEWCERIKLK